MYFLRVVDALVQQYFPVFDAAQFLLSPLLLLLIERHSSIRSELLDATLHPRSWLFFLQIACELAAVQTRFDLALASHALFLLQLCLPHCSLDGSHDH